MNKRIDSINAELSKRIDATISDLAIIKAELKVIKERNEIIKVILRRVHKLDEKVLT